MKNPYIKVFCERGELIRPIKKGDFVGAKNAAWNQRTMNIVVADIFGKVKKIMFMNGDNTPIKILTPASEGVEATKKGIKIATGTLIIKWVGDRKD